VRFLTARKEAVSMPIPGVTVEWFEEPPEPPESLSPLQAASAAAISRAAAVEARLYAMAQAGFVPRLAVVHGGNGLGLLIKQLIPNCVVVGYFEWYFHPDQAGDMLGRNDRLSRQLLQLRNLSTCQELVSCDAAVVPTPWQASQFPEPLRAKLQVIFDGVDPHWHQPPADPARNWPLRIEGEAGVLELQAGQPLLTYATRGMEPLRGFPEFMRALPAVLAARPELVVLVAGRDRSAYGLPAPSHGGSWKERLLEELGDFPGRERLHFTGLLPRAAYVAMLQRTNLHCYFTRPFVPSWSLFEAVACGAPLLTTAGGATTGTLLGVLTHAIDLSMPVEQLSDRICQTLDSAPSPQVPPQWIWRASALQKWESLLQNAFQVAASTP
jgi:glycosyltransferase involved in cell wall biosynthesis